MKCYLGILTEEENVKVRNICLHKYWQKHDIVEAPMRRKANIPSMNCFINTDNQNFSEKRVVFSSPELAQGELLGYLNVCRPSSVVRRASCVVRRPSTISC